jgi:hypothetical protein
LGERGPAHGTLEAAFDVEAFDVAAQHGSCGDGLRQAQRIDGRAAVAFVTAALNLPSAPHRQATLEGLTETLAMRCLSTLRLRLHDPHQPVRAEALRWVFRLEDEGCVGELSKLLHRPSTQTGERKALYHALFHLGAREALIEAVTTEADLDSLAELMGLVTRDSDPDTRELLLEVSKDPTMPVPRRKVIEAGLKAWVGR